MNLKAILTKAGVTDDLDEIVESIKSEICTEFVSKKQYAKKNERVDELEGKIADFELANKDDYKEKFEALTTEFEQFKTGLEVKKDRNTKINALVEHLKESGVDESLADLLKDRFDIDAIELENNKIKDWESKLEPIKTKFSNFFTETEVKGQGVNTPPILSNNKGEQDPFLMGFGK